MIRRFSLLAALSLTCAGFSDQPRTSKQIFAEHFEKGLSPSWKEHVFQGHTTYQVVEDGTNHVLRATAQAAASGVGQELQVKVAPGTTLSWRWKIDQLPPGASDQDLKTFDHSARIYIAFKALLAPRTINYTWSASGKIGAQSNHPSSNRARIIVLESGSEKVGQWVVEKRDIYQDWKALFGDEPPEIQSIGLMTDSDGTKANVTGYYDDIVLSQP
jgi:hypothetical protein